MLLKNKTLGSALIIAGTAIGAGMLQCRSLQPVSVSDLLLSY